MCATLSTQQSCLTQAETAGDEVASCPLFLPWKHFGTQPLFPGPVGQHTFTSCVTVPWWHSSRQPRHRMGGMKRLCLVFPTETPRRLLGFSSSRSLTWFPSPAVVEATFPPDPLSASLCKLFESTVCLHAHLLLEGAARWQILPWKWHTLMSQYLFLFCF